MDPNSGQYNYYIPQPSPTQPSVNVGGSGGGGGEQHHGGMVDHHYEGMYNNNFVLQAGAPVVGMDMNTGQMRSGMQIPLQQPYGLQMQNLPQQQMAYDPNRGMHAYGVPQFDHPISPAQSLSDNSHSGTESVGHPYGGGVPHARQGYHGHSHSLSSTSSSSSIALPQFESADPDTPYMPKPPRGRPRRERRAPSSPPLSAKRSSLPSPVSGDDGNDYLPTPMSRKETTRRQRIEAEQRRRDELRDGYHRLKNVLPLSTAKSSKSSLIDRARAHILDLEQENSELKAKLAQIEQDLARLQSVNDKFMMSVSQPIGVPGGSPVGVGAVGMSGVAGGVGIGDDFGHDADYSGLTPVPTTEGANFHAD